MVLPTTYLTSVTTLVKNDMSSTFTYVGFGTGTATPTTADTTLTAEVLRVARQDITALSNGQTISGYLNGTQANGSVLAECGIFDASSSGNMKQKALFPSTITKTSDKEVWVDVTVIANVTQS